MIKSKGEYLTTFEVAEIVGLSQKHINRLLSQGKLKGQKLGNNWIMETKDIKAIKRQRKRKKKDGST